eukprot:Unigene9301_Nuclearia_a/m.28401 Unigene9301_Nuclearia_a/g.28401  ORF Unigene9301_Nuclearia_a/g.28401 Unigene9301_Nuclearia_a/m.28401 type:complete len:403 (-) Unigene9301_Nuclearia_a:102-1310(-)
MADDDRELQSDSNAVRTPAAVPSPAAPSPQDQDDQHQDDHHGDAVASPPAVPSPEDDQHVQQVFLNPGAGYVCRTDVPFERVLRDDAPRAPYRRRRDEAKTVIHWGQRKLLMSEIEFLTRFRRPDRAPLRVLYAGAAPGTHLRLLSSLFPEVSFVLVDPAPFTVAGTARMQLLQEPFTDNVALRYSGSGELLFISDVRTAQSEDDAASEAAVQADMRAQMHWHALLRPRASMLKFRLPWTAGQTTYLAGELHLPVWGPVTTTETRLVVPGPGEASREYDHVAYMEQLFHFNTVTRVALYAHPVPVPPHAAEGLDRCYDCAAEVRILLAYLAGCRGSSASAGVEHEPPEGLGARVTAMSRRISRVLGGAVGRTLRSPNDDPAVRAEGIRARQQLSTTSIATDN